MALTKDRNTASKSILRSIDYPVKASTLIYDGSLVALSAGFAVPAADAAGAKVVGVADWRADNSAGADGDKHVRVRQGVFKLDNATAPNAIAQAQVGSAAYVLDDHTVTKTDPTNHTVAGEILEIDPDGGIWVLVTTVGPVGPVGPQGPQGIPG
jgi:hypothetical protein